MKLGLHFLTELRFEEYLPLLQIHYIGLSNDFRL